ncbi:hypothetical protein FRC14_005138 [Serendipita sp. 396]|nr:hypothetical protein FRC14_005138 [Serendipita sp. 396]KAG8789571.1 hypothetical protein FRC15_006303 [Serendipita sp. 397]KAG8802826.1 hypothetical protein FRC16_008547 [Serendipita sp. 398]KAG8823724.1 hypothetical protein FRC18_010680 [Serendipita sp. 400]KAG8824223.1 hypothetical protein FRC19_002215 [Serendipita sp. 401]KAG8872599.1 hypothetical protein FRC20_009259 [Serendipita sp. 405]KAG9054227.1 hypothetical protein FS842_005716 [Serendipita sp. 407]
MRFALLATIFATVATFIVAAPIPAGETNSVSTIVSAGTQSSVPSLTDLRHPTLVRRTKEEIARSHEEAAKYKDLLVKHAGQAQVTTGAVQEGHLKAATKAGHLTLGHTYAAQAMETRMKGPASTSQEDIAEHNGAVEDLERTSKHHFGEAAKIQTKHF